MSEKHPFIPEGMGWESTGDEGYESPREIDPREEQGAYDAGPGATHYDGDEAAKRAREQETGMEDNS